MPYLAKLEKAGIPTVLIDFNDQIPSIKQEALAAGVPNIRHVTASRTIPGPEDVDRWIEPMLEMLTKPLTDDEKEEGLHSPPQQRILFEGTLDEAQEFYQQTRMIPDPLNAPISVYTDGLPIIVPTEERVAEMLKGTSHRPDEIITRKKGAPRFAFRGGDSNEVRFQPRLWTATVEKVAINAVMAGCKPEHLPVVLAIAQSGVQTGTTVINHQWMCLSGPIVKEIGINSGTGMMGPGNPAGMAIGRAYQLMAINLGGAVPGVSRMSSIGSPISRGGLCFGECEEKLPPGWKGLNEDFGFRKDESVVLVQGGEGGFNGAQFSPGGYRALQKSGHGGMARRLGVKGIPGPHNWLDWILPDIWVGDREGSRIFVMVHEMAYDLYRLGFKSKDEVLEYIWKKSFEPLKKYRDRSWVDLWTNGWMGIEPTSGKPWKELPDDYLVAAAGNSPQDSYILVCGSDEEICYEMPGGVRRGDMSSVYSIDDWR